MTQIYILLFIIQSVLRFLLETVKVTAACFFHRRFDWHPKRYIILLYFYETSFIRTVWHLKFSSGYSSGWLKNEVLQRVFIFIEVTMFKMFLSAVNCDSSPVVFQRKTTFIEASFISPDKEFHSWMLSVILSVCAVKLFLCVRLSVWNAKKIRQETSRVGFSCFIKLRVPEGAFILSHTDKIRVKICPWC